MPRPSFRQLLLVAFLFLALLLGAVAVRGQATLERLLERSRLGAERSLRLSGHVSRLGEQGPTMERAARQYLVLGDASLRETFERAADDTARQVQTLVDSGVAPAVAVRWNEQRLAIESVLGSRSAATTAPAAIARDRSLAQAFRDLDALNADIGEQVRRITEERNAALQEELEAGRVAVGRLLAGSLAVATVLALALALALARPLRRVESAIVALGENRLDDRIEIRGPSDVREIGRRLDWLRQRLHSTDADKARFLRHVSHELKTPLAALREGVALLQDEVAGPLSSDQREVSRILHDNTAALQRRIEDLLSFNATAFAAQRLVRKPTDVADLVRSQVDEQQLQWRARHLTVEVSGTPVVADIDAALIASAVGNLLANAIRFSPRGSRIGVDVKRDEPGDGVAIEVADQGPGIAPAERDRVFEPFYRGAQQPADAPLAGTGIGLSIVAEAAAAHGGRAMLLPDDPAAPGARFRIDLPHALSD